MERVRLIIYLTRDKLHSEFQVAMQPQKRERHTHRIRQHCLYLEMCLCANKADIIN